MKGKIGIIIYWIFFVHGIIIAQKTHKYTIKKDKQLSAFDSIIKQSFKNKILITSSCDTTILIDELSAFKKAIEINTKDHIGLICDLGNFYHAWMILTLCRNPSLIRAGNDEHLYVRDTMILDKAPYTLKSLRETILKLGLQSKIHLTFSLWDGTKSGAHPPKKSWTKQSLKSLILASGRALLKNSDDVFTADLAVNTLCISEQIVRELCDEQQNSDLTKLLPILTQYLPEHISAYCALHKAQMRLRRLPVSDILARSP